MLDSAAWPLTGRAREVKVITAALNGTSGCAGVAITGGLGVGKSRLARVGVARAERSVAHWTAGSAAARGIPLGAFVRWLPEDSTNPAQLAGRVIDALLAGTRDLVVGVDDAQLLDDTSAFLLHQLVDRRRARVVLTVRSGTAVPDAVASLWRNGPVQRLDLQPLDRDDCAELVAAALGGPMDPFSQRRLWQLTGGNPKFLRHILEQETDDGRIRYGDGRWIWQAGYSTPPTVCELIEHEMGELAGVVAETIDLLAVAEPLPARMLVDLVGVGPVEEAESRSLIVVDDADEPQVRLAHPLYGEVRRARAGRIRLRRLRGIVAARLAAQGRADVRHCLRRCALILDSDIVPTPDDALHAAEAALWRGDSGLALRFAQAAASSGAGWPAAVASADALSLAGRTSDAQAALAALVADPPPAAAAPVRVANAWNLYLQGRMDEAFAALRRGAAPVGGTDPGAGASLAMHAFLSASVGDSAAAARDAEAALARSDLSGPAVMIATIAQVTVMGETGDADRLDAVSSRATAVGRTAATSFLRFALAEARSSALQLLGFPARALDAVEAVRDDDQPAEMYAWINMMTGSAGLAAGRIDDAVNRIRDVISPSGCALLGGWLARYYVELAIALAVRGESAAAEQCLQRFDGLAHPPVAGLESMNYLAKGWISVSTGAVSVGIAQSRIAAASAAAHGLSAREVLCLQTATRFGDTATAARLAELARVVRGPRAAAAAEHAVALAHGGGEQLMAVSARYEAMGDLLCGVDAAAQASVAFTRANRRGSALAAAARARRLAEGCGTVRTPAMVAAAAPPTFTDREREIISLVGQGLTNRAIAERLQLSIRTVEGHLYRSAARVGAGDRKELARLIHAALDGDGLGRTA